MSKQILRQINFPNNYSQEYALTQNHPRTRCTLNLDAGDKNLSLHKKWFDGTFDDFPTREKIYFQNGDIMHTSNCGAYTAIMPSNGTGTFVVSDNGINIRGEMQKGKIAKLNDFYELGTPSRIALPLPEEKTHAIRQHIESVLEMTKKGSLKIQNLTSVMLRKALQFLPK